MLQVNWTSLTTEEIEFVDNLIRADIGSIVTADEIPDLIENGILQSEEDVFRLRENAERFLSHLCNERCKERVSESRTRCRKVNYGKVTPDPTSNVFIPIEFTLSNETQQILKDIGMLTHESSAESPGFEPVTTFTHPFSLHLDTFLQ
jgi:hypothetical protein